MSATTAFGRGGRLVLFRKRARTATWLNVSRRLHHTPSHRVILLFRLPSATPVSPSSPSPRSAESLGESSDEAASKAKISSGHGAGLRVHNTRSFAQT